MRRPVVPEGDRHSGHLFYLLLNSVQERDALIEELRQRGVHAVFHYVPLHESPAGERFGRVAGPVDVTPDVSARLVRLPLWSGLEERRVARVIGAVHDAVAEIARQVPAA